MSLQEEMDWIIYAVCGLIPIDPAVTGLGIFSFENPWELDSGQRPFELALNNAGPLAEWEPQRRELWVSRINALQRNAEIASIENSIFKRRLLLGLIESRPKNGLPCPRTEGPGSG